MSKYLIIAGIILIIIGICLPWIKKTGLGRLPGDIFIKSGDFGFYFPIVSCIIISIIITILINIFKK